MSPLTGVCIALLLCGVAGLRWLYNIERKVDQMAVDLSGLVAEVAEVKGTVESAVALLQGMQAKIEALLALGDPVAIQAGLNELRDALNVEQEKLAAAVAAVPPPTP